MTRRLAPGRYFVAVEARDGAHGNYVLSRLTRVITRASMVVNGARRATVSPGSSVQLTLRVTPAGAAPQAWWWSATTRSPAGCSTRATTRA